MDESALQLIARNVVRQLNLPLMVSGAAIVAIAGLACLWLRKSYKGYARLQKINAADRSFFRAMVALAVVYFFVYAYLSVWRWYKLLCGSWDMGIFWSLLDNALHGRFLQDYRGPFDHFDISLALYLPFYALWRDARLLLVLESLVVALGVWPLYLLAKEVSGKVVVASVIGIAYLLYPFLGAGTVYDFHALSLGPVFFFAMLLFMVRRRWKWYWVFLALLLLVKESQAILVFGAGLYLLSQWNQPGRRTLMTVGAATVVISVAWFFIATMVLLPWISGAEFRHFGRYEGFGDLITWVLTTSEGRVHAAVYPARVAAVFTFVALPVSFFFLRRWRPFVLVFGPYFAVNIFSRALYQNVFFGHYVLTVAAAVLGSTALAADRLKGFSEDEDASVWPVFVVVVAALSNLLYSWPANYRLYFPANHVYFDRSFNVLSLPLPVTEKRRAFYTLDQHERFFRHVRGLFPKGSTIATQNSLGCYFAVGYQLEDFKQENKDVVADYYLFDCGRGDSMHTPPETYEYLLRRLSSDPGTVEFLNLYRPDYKDYFVFFAAGDKWKDFYRNALAAHERDPENESFKIAIRAVVKSVGLEKVSRVGLPADMLRLPALGKDPPAQPSGKPQTAPRDDGVADRPSDKPSGEDAPPAPEL